ncbi:MAG TPA: hypothetical protein VFF31_10065 [Blastocatellia bacterium]|nr:hypothetical protein [Blastocatellia bacterium]
MNIYNRRIIPDLALFGAKSLVCTEEERPPVLSTNRGAGLHDICDPAGE